MTRSDFVKLPPHGAGQTIGLYGGSFNPPHAGHRLVSELALTRLGLDRLWWLATPGNPLKSNADLERLEARIAAAQALARNPRISVTGFEAKIGARYTRQTLSFLQARAPGARFVWVMGADNLAQFHRWRQWRQIADMMPILIVDRPGWTLRAMSSRSAQALWRFRVPAREARRLALRQPPAWLFLHGRRSPASSTALREARRGGG